MTPDQRKARLQEVIERRRKSLASKPKPTMSTKTVDMSRSPEVMKKRVAETSKYIKEKKRISSENERIRSNRMAKQSAKSGEEYMVTTRDGKQRRVMKAKHGGALAIMIAPVKTDKMKAVKKGAHGAKVKKAPGGAAMSKMKMKMMKKGGKLKMVKGPDGKMVPFYAADGKGKMMYGGSMKKKMAMGGRMGSKEMMESMKKDDKMLKHGGSMKKAMYGAKMKKKKAMYGAKMKK